MALLAVALTTGCPTLGLLLRLALLAPPLAFTFPANNLCLCRPISRILDLLDVTPKIFKITMYITPETVTYVNYIFRRAIYREIFLSKRSFPYH